MRTHLSIPLALLAAALISPCAAAPATITVDVAKPGHAVSPTLWGIFFEDINLSADGGLYAELIRNRSFEDSDKPEQWTFVSKGGAQGKIAITDEKPMAADPKKSFNKRSLRLDLTKAAPDGAVGVSNGGYWGVPVKQGEEYHLSLAARASTTGADLTASLESADGKTVYATARVGTPKGDWSTMKTILKSKGTDANARLVITTAQAGTVWLDMVSLFPAKTWKDHPNGLRPDLAEMLLAMKPAFVRFPGGCWVEGNTMAESYRWKQTIGPLHERRTQWNIWGYQATHGLGFHEYLQLCEDLKAEPLFCINVGMSHRENVPMDKMDEYVQDALDALEYANGPASSKWGAVRAKAGHPKPFGMRFMEIGNENGGPAYKERWPLFVKAIKAKYPEVRLVANHWAGGYPAEPRPDIVDEHYYSTPEFFMREAGKYDSYDRKGPQIFVGEYAVTQNTGNGSLRGAIGEAAFMTGLERNSDIVAMASYAPLFVHVNHRHWNPDLINFDNTRAYGLPSYYVQQMFAANPGSRVLPTEVQADDTVLTLPVGPIGVGTWLTQAEFKDIKVVKDGQVLYQSDFSKGTQGWKMHGGEWKVENGALCQKAGGDNIRALFGEKNWEGYTLSLKARKLGGDEGFLILFGADAGGKSWWNLGGWGNKQHGIEFAGETMDAKAGHIENGRWYDIGIDLSGGRIKCTLDGQLVHDIQPPKNQTLFASSTLDDKTGEVIVKVVNGAREAREAVIDLKGAGQPEVVKALLLTSANAMDENSLDQPEKVSPKPVELTVEGGRLRHTLPANSFLLVRLRK